MTSTISRRSLTKRAAWSVPALAIASAAPAMAASGLTDLAVEVGDPPTDINSGDYVDTVPIYKSNQTSVATKASITTAFTITNVGTVAATNPSGTVDLQFYDYGTDVPVAKTEAAKFNLVPTTPGVAFTKVASESASGSGNKYAYTYTGALQPGQSVTITVKMWVASPFAHATAMQMLFTAFVADQTDGDWDDNSSRTGHIPSFGA